MIWSPYDLSTDAETDAFYSMSQISLMRTFQLNLFLFFELYTQRASQPASHIRYLSSVVKKIFVPLIPSSINKLIKCVNILTERRFL